MQTRNLPTWGLRILGTAALAIAMGCAATDQPSDLATTPEMALANHLSETRSKMYGAYWCPHCDTQKEMFGDAFDEIDYVECDPEGDNARPQLCEEAGIPGYPTWEIDGELYPGVRSLAELAELANYQGPANFSDEDAQPES